MFEIFNKATRINPTDTKIQFVSANEIKVMDTDHTQLLIETMSHAITQKVLLNVMEKL
tara:strand:+ start:174 stop:347 length:174 start_codon:yes stop_codon:yes gene_type:complete